MPRNHLLHLITLTGVGLLLILSQLMVWFPVKDIDCQLDDQPCPEQVAQLLAPLQEKSYFFTNFPNQAQALVPAESITVVTAHQTGLGSIRVELSQIGTEYLVTYQDGRTFLVSPTGKLSPSDSTSQVWFDQPYAGETQLPTQLHHALSLTQQSLAALQVPWQKLDVFSPQKILLELEQPPHVIMDTSITAEQLEVLPQILAAESIRTLDTPIVEIDLRFNLPVLRTESGD